MGFVKSDRLSKIPPYLFIEIDRLKREAIDAGKDVINLGIGDPDRPTPGFIIDRMAEAMRDPANHRYPFDFGVPEFQQEAAAFFRRRFEVDFEPGSELITLIGSKEGIGHLPMAVINAGDTVLVPQPGYPVYQAAAIIAGGEPYHMPLSAERGWTPDLDAIPSEVAERASLMYLNYPNNPTAAVATYEFFERAVEFARKYGLVIAQDAAYSEVYYEEKPISIMQVPGAREVAVEFHSLSKTFNMTGWRIGFVAGGRDIIAALSQVKGNMDSGQFNAIQWAGIEALKRTDHPDVTATLEAYRNRRDALVDGMTSIGWKIQRPAATFFTWIQCPDGVDSMTVVTRLLKEADVVTVPGVGFGEPGEGYIRVALTIDAERIQEAIERIQRIDW
jgi:LL-diaminopimelate aminotransferase